MSKKELAKLYTSVASKQRQIDIYSVLELFSTVGSPAVRAGDKAMVDRMDALQRVLKHYGTLLVRDEERGAKARAKSAANRTKATPEKLTAWVDAKSDKDRARRVGVHPTTYARAKKRLSS